MSDLALKWARERQRDGSNKGPPATFGLLMLLADMTRSGHELFPSIATLAEESGLDERTLRRAMASLEDDGLLEREQRFTASGKSTSARYRLTAFGWNGKPLSEAERGGSLADVGGAECEGRGRVLTGSTSFEPSSLSAESSDELSVSVVQAREGDGKKQAAADPAEAAYLQLEAHWLRVAPGRVAEREARWAFSAAISDGTLPAMIAACGMRFLAESPDAKAGKVAMLHRWLADRRWRGWEPKIAAPSSPAPNLAAASGGWCEAGELFVEAVLRDKGADWAGSWLGRCDWDPAERVLVAPLSITADKLRRELSALLLEHGVGVVLRRAA